MSETKTETKPEKTMDRPASNTSSVDNREVTTESRYWGTVTVLESGDRYRISRVEIKPGHRLKTQIHYHRSEHWIVVSGTAKVICGDNESLVVQNQSTYVPACTPHHLENPGVIPLVLIEVQNGEYLGEQDIVRPEADGDRPNP